MSGWFGVLGGSRMTVNRVKIDWEERKDESLF
jgi:hypothetical protein